MKIFVFFVIVALAVTGALEWFKSVTSGRAVPTWLTPALSAILSISAGVAAVFAGLFAEFFTPATAVDKLLAGLIVGFVALGFIELAYQLLVQLFIAAVHRVVQMLQTTDDKTIEDAVDSAATKVNPTGTP